MLLRILINPVIFFFYGGNDSGDADDGGADHDVTQVQGYCSTNMADIEDTEFPPQSKHVHVR